jgi:hypothetical protein
MTAVMIGIDPYKGSHTAVASRRDECAARVLGSRAGCPAVAEIPVSASGWMRAVPVL